MAEKNYTCAHCGVGFSSVRARKYCDKACTRKAQDRKKHPQTRAEYLARCSSGGNWFVCEQCGKDSHRKLSGTNKKKGSGNRFCSMACKKAMASDLRQQRAAEMEAFRLKVKPEIEALRRIGARARALHAQVTRAEYVAASLVRRCTDCGDTFTQRTHLGTPEKRCGPCEVAQHRRLRRIYKSRRKAAARGVEADSIDPMKVFARDKWKCHICGVRALKSLRGTYDDRAPELEHIVPLAQGGTHTWGNVACSCRKCNGAKGATAYGQLGLGLAA